jgi:hypothetical protein
LGQVAISCQSADCCAARKIIFMNQSLKEGFAVFSDLVCTFGLNSKLIENDLKIIQHLATNFMSLFKNEIDPDICCTPLLGTTKCAHSRKTYFIIFNSFLHQLPLLDDLLFNHSVN